MYTDKNVEEFAEKNRNSSPQIQAAIAWVIKNIDIVQMIIAETKPISSVEMEHYIQKAKSKNDFALTGVLMYKQYLDDEKIDKKSPES